MNRIILKKIFSWSIIGVFGFVAAYTAHVISFGIQRTEVVQQKIAQLHINGLKADEFPSSWIEELLAVEDPRFWTHNGIDLRSPGAGITTITQGMVKIHYFDKFRPGIAKYKQSVLAMVLDYSLSKEDLLVLFLNTASFGNQSGTKVHGFGSASTAYFGKPFSEISHFEYLSLVAMLIGPSKYNLERNPTANQNRVDKISNFLAGKCSPDGLFDVEYTSCEPILSI